MLSVLSSWKGVVVAFSEENIDPMIEIVQILLQICKFVGLILLRLIIVGEDAPKKKFCVPMYIDNFHVPRISGASWGA